MAIEYQKSKYTVDGTFWEHCKMIYCFNCFPKFEHEAHDHEQESQPLKYDPTQKSELVKYVEAMRKANYREQDRIRQVVVKPMLITEFLIQTLMMKMTVSIQQMKIMRQPLLLLSVKYN